MASISSKTITCKGLSYPNSASSLIAFLNKFRIFYSDSPTNLLNIYGPFTIIISVLFMAYEIFLAIKVLPVPGGPYSNKPLTCLIPNFSNNEGGNFLELKTLLNIIYSYFFNPPMPKFYKEIF